jgi:predicted GTPase
MAAKNDTDTELSQILEQLRFHGDDAKKLKKIFKKRGQAGVDQYLKEKQDEWKNTPLNIAVIGASGVGKSTFVNAIRGLRVKDPRAAPVGVKQTTMTVTRYPHPVHENLIFWDIPGVGTKEFPKESYLKKIGIDRFDFFLLLSAGRFTEIDAWLGREITEKHRKKYYYVRTKVDQDVDNDRAEKEEDHDVNKVLNEIRQDIQQNIDTRNKVSGLFLVAGRRPDLFDFRKLEKSIVDDFPESKRSALILSMCAMSESMIQMKVAELRARIKYSAMGAGGVAVVPVPLMSVCYDMLIVETQAKEYFHQLGLDNDSLRKLADQTACNFEDLKAVIRETFGPTFYDKFDIHGFLGQLPKYSSTNTAFCAQRIIQLLPVIGGIIASPITLATTYKTLALILEEMEKMALNVVRYANEHSTLH